MFTLLVFRTQPDRGTAIHRDVAMTNVMGYQEDTHTGVQGHALGCGAPNNISWRPGDVDDHTRGRWVTGGGWVAAGWPQLREWWCGGHRVLVTRWGGDGQLIGGATVGPTPVFFPLVTSAA